MFNVRLDESLAIGSGHVTDFCLWFNLERDIAILSAHLSKCIAIIHISQQQKYQALGAFRLGNTFK